MHLPVLFICVILTSGCVHPLGPGFHFAAREAEISAVPGSPNQLRVRVVDRLENAGDRTLHSLEVRLPESPSFGTQNLQMSIEGKEVLPEHSSTADRRMMSASFDPAWKQDQSRKIVAEWNLFPSTEARGSIAVSERGFYVADETALPLWQTPPGIFSRGEPDPEKEFLTILAPPDFRVIAPGKPVKSRTNSAGPLQPRKFRMRPDRDFLPYVVSGRYQETSFREHRGTVNFWTFGPLDRAAGDKAAARLSSSWAALEDFFGPASRGANGIHIVEAPNDLPSEFNAGDGISADGRDAEMSPGGASFPRGALLNSAAFAEGIAGETVLEAAEYELTRTWFGWRTRPTPEAQILMGRGVGLFGLVLAAEARGPEERRRMVASLLARYDAQGAASNKRLMQPPFGYTRAERISAGFRAALFLIELEDLCGRSSMRTAFRHIIYARTGAETGYQELRAAVEATSHRDLADVFRQWLIHPSIPDEFRARYEQGR